MANVNPKDNPLVVSVAGTEVLPVYQDGWKTVTVQQIVDAVPETLVPDSLSDLLGDATHRTVTDTEKSTWNGKQSALGFTPEVVGVAAGLLTTHEATHAPANAEQNVQADWNALTGDAAILNKPTIPSTDGLLNEAAHDDLNHAGLTGILALGTTAGTAMAGNTAIPTQYTDEMAQDASAAMIAAGTHTGISFTYSDADNKLSATVTASGSGDVTGPSSAAADNFVSFNSTTGKVIKDSGSKASDFATAGHNHTGTYAPALGTDDNYVTDAEKSALHAHSNKSDLDNVSGTNTGNETASSIGTLVSGSTANTSPVDTDLISITTSSVLGKITWAYVKSTLKTYFDTLYAAAGSYLTSGGALGTPSSGTLTNCTGYPADATKADKGLVTTSGLTQSTNKLLGRATAATGTIEEISLGTGLSFTGTTLNSSGIAWSYPVSITGTATLAFGSYNIVTVTSEDTTLILPQVTASDYGKMLAVDISAATTKLITIDGYSSQTIDGTLTRTMWAKEVAQLVATSAGWTKVAGKTIPMFTHVYPSAAMSVTNGVRTYVPLNTVSTNSGFLSDVSNNRITIPRAGSYLVKAVIYYQAGSASLTLCQCVLDLNTTVGGVGFESIPYAITSTMVIKVILNEIVTASAGDYFRLNANIAGDTRNLYVNEPTWTSLKVQEVPIW